MNDKDNSVKCCHQSTIMYDEFKDENGLIVSKDFKVCRECNMVIFNDKEMGYMPNDTYNKRGMR